MKERNISVGSEAEIVQPTEPQAEGSNDRRISSRGMPSDSLGGLLATAGTKVSTTGSARRHLTIGTTNLQPLSSNVSPAPAKVVRAMACSAAC